MIQNGSVITKVMVVLTCVGLLGIVLLPGTASGAVVSPANRGNLQTYYTTIYSNVTSSQGNTIKIQVDVFKSTSSPNVRMCYVAQVIMYPFTNYCPQWATTNVDAIACRMYWADPTSANQAVNFGAVSGNYLTPYSVFNGTGTSSMYMGVCLSGAYQHSTTSAGTDYARWSTSMSYTKCTPHITEYQYIKYVDYRVYTQDYSDRAFYTGCIVEKPYTPATQKISFQVNCYFKIAGGQTDTITKSISISQAC